MDTLNSFHHLSDPLGPPLHPRGPQHELGQVPDDMGLEGPFLELVQIIDEVLGIDTDGLAGTALR